MTDHRDPWHILTITGLYYHEDPECPGHRHPDEGTTDDGIDYDLEHVDSCQPAYEIDGIPMWRCCTEYEMDEGDHDDWPRLPGVYKAMGWSSGPDYGGEYENGFEWQPLDVDESPEPAVTCQFQVDEADPRVTRISMLPQFEYIGSWS